MAMTSAQQEMFQDVEHTVETNMAKNHDKSSNDNDDFTNSKVEIIFDEGIVPFAYMSEESTYSESTSQTPPLTIRRCCISYQWMFILCLFAVERECAQNRNLFSPILM